MVINWIIIISSFLSLLLIVLIILKQKRQLIKYERYLDYLDKQERTDLYLRYDEWVDKHENECPVCHGEGATLFTEDGEPIDLCENCKTTGKIL